MNRIYKYITLAAVSCFSAVSVFAQDVVLDKSAKKNTDGSYTITLETFATGTAKHVSAKDQPIDAVLVLDVSGSMDNPIASGSYPVNAKDGSNNISITQLNLLDSRYTLTSELFFVKIHSTYGTSSGVGDSGYVYYPLFVSKQLIPQTPDRYVYEGTFWYKGNEYTITCQQSANSSSFSVSYMRNGASVNGDTVLYSSGNGNNATRTKLSDLQVYVNQNNKSYSSCLQALQNACKTFVKSLYEKSVGKNATHRVSIIVWSSDGYQNDTKLTLANGDVTENYETDIYPIIDKLYSYGGTTPSLGMSRAQTQFNSARPDAAKVLVFFTDGKPDSDSAANSAISTANTLKNATNNVTIYSVTTQSLKDNTDNWKYLQEVSSNYKYSNTTPTISNYSAANKIDSKYYAEASDASTLDNVFHTIVEETDVDEEAAIDEEAVLKDIVTTQFILPEGVENSGIKTYTAEIEEVKEEKTDPKEKYIFKKENGIEKWEEVTNVTVAPVVVDGEPTTINVSGFDFGSNWCGVVQNENIKNYQGKKLIIQFDVIPNPDDEGGYYTTNSDLSGVYVDGKLYEDKTTGDPAKYPQPDPVFSDLVTYIKVENLVGDDVAFYDIICKNGPNEGKIWTVAVRNSVSIDGNGNSTYSPMETRVKLPVTYPDAAGNDIFYVYDIVEHNSEAGKSGVWTWSYKTADGKAASYTNQTLYELVNGVADPTKPNNHFTFYKTSNGTTVLHDEANIPNEFKAYSTANPGTGSSD